MGGEDVAHGACGALVVPAGKAERPGDVDVVEASGGELPSHELLMDRGNLDAHSVPAEAGTHTPCPLDCPQPMSYLVHILASARRGTLYIA
jgi:hypothetical protein